MSFFIENEVTVSVFFKRLDLKQNDVADDRVKIFGVIKRLIWIVNRFGINSGTIFGVVFDFDRQVTTDGFYEHPVIDRDMRMLAIAMQVAVSPHPLKIMLRRPDHFVITAVIDVS